MLGALQITNAGRTALSNAIVKSEALTVSRVLLTDAATTRVLANIKTPGELGGSIVAELEASGAQIGEGQIQVEASDPSQASYAAQTLALCFNGEGGLEVFGVYSAQEPFLYKTQDTTAQIVAGVSIDPADAQSITFDGITLNFPPATENRNGAVSLATAAQVVSGAPGSASRPIVPTAEATNAAFKSALGDEVFDGSAVIKNSLEIGEMVFSEFADGWQLVGSSNPIYERELGADFDWRSALGAYGSWDGGTRGSGEFVSTHHENGGSPFFYFVDTATNADVGGIIKNGSGVWVLQVYSEGRSPVLGIWLKSGGAAQMLTASAHTLRGDRVELGHGATGGGAEVLTIAAHEFSLQFDGVFRRYGIPARLVSQSAGYGHPVKISVNGADFVTGKYTPSTRLITFDSGAAADYRLTATGILEYRGSDAPQDLRLSIIKSVSVEVSHAVKAYGHDLMLAQGCLGWVKFRYSATEIGGKKLFIADSYQMTIELDGSELLVRFSTPDGAADLRSMLSMGGSTTTINFFEAVASGEVFNSGTESRYFDAQGVDSTSIAFDTSKSFYGMIRVY